MAAESAVNRSAMAAAAKQVEDAVTQVRGQQAQLTGFHGDMMNGWQGDAANAFTTAYEAFNADFTQVINALQEQLGLDLRPATGPVETLVVDHVERPSEN